MDIDIETCDPACGFTTCIYPRETSASKASWIIWVSKDGSGQLYTKRAKSGAVLGKPLILPANVSE